MDELPAAQIDTHVADAASAGVEEHQVAGGPLRRGNGGTQGVLAGGAVGQGDAKLGKHLHGEAGTVDAAVAGAAVAVRRAQIGVAEGDDVLHQRAGGVGALVIGVVYRLAVLGHDVAGGAAVAHLVPVVILHIDEVGHLAGPDGPQGGGVLIGLSPQGDVVLTGGQHAVVLRQEVLLLQFLRLADQGLSGQLRQGQGAFAFLQRAGLLGQAQPVGSLKGGSAAGGHTAGGQSLHGCAVFIRCDQSGLAVVLRLRTGCHDAAGQHHDGGHAERGQLFQIHGYYLPFVS